MDFIEQMRKEFGEGQKPPKAKQKPKSKHQKVFEKVAMEIYVDIETADLSRREKWRVNQPVIDALERSSGMASFLGSDLKEDIFYGSNNTFNEMISSRDQYCSYTGEIDVESSGVTLEMIIPEKHQETGIAALAKAFAKLEEWEAWCTEEVQFVPQNDEFVSENSLNAPYESKDDMVAFFDANRVSEKAPEEEEEEEPEDEYINRELQEELRGIVKVQEKEFRQMRDQLYRYIPQIVKPGKFAKVAMEAIETTTQIRDYVRHTLDETVLKMAKDALKAGRSVSEVATMYLMHSRVIDWEPDADGLVLNGYGTMQDFLDRYQDEIDLDGADAKLARHRPEDAAEIRQIEKAADRMLRELLEYGQDKKGPMSGWASYQFAYIEAIANGKEFTEAKTAAYAAARYDLSPSGERAYQQAERNGAEQKAAWREFWATAGQTGEFKEVERIASASPEGLNIVTGGGKARFVNWGIAIMKAKAGEISLTQEMVSILRAQGWGHNLTKLYPV